MSRKVFSLFANDLSKPFSYFRAVYIIVIHPILIASIIWRIDIDALYATFIFWEQSLECFKIVSMNDLIFGCAPFTVEGFLQFQCTKRNIQMMIQYSIFSEPIQ